LHKIILIQSVEAVALLRLWLNLLSAKIKPVEIIYC